MRINALKSLLSLTPGTVITDALFDDLRYGNTAIAEWVNSFGTAAALQAACEEHEARNKDKVYHVPLHTARRLYESFHVSKGYYDRKNRANGAEPTANNETVQEARERDYALAVRHAQRKQTYLRTYLATYRARQRKSRA